MNGQTTPGIVIGFTDEVQVSTVNAAGGVVQLIDAEHIFQVLVDSDPSGDAGKRFALSLPDRGTVIPVQLDLDTRDPYKGRRVTSIRQTIPPGQRTRRRLSFRDSDSPWHRIIASTAELPDLWVVLRGDFVKDRQDRAIDAEFVRAELPTGDRPRPQPHDHLVSGGAV